MAVTYGFYNSLNGDRKYNAEQISAIFDGVITDGVFGSIGGALMTIAGEGMQVLVKTGKAWFNSTWTLNDAQMALPIDTADVSLTRIDAVVLEVNSGISTRENSIKVIKGTPSANPVKPTMASDEDLHQYALAYVTVAANATSITAANIEVNVGKTGCPFVTSVLQQTSITDLFAQWEAEFDTWFDNVQAQLAGDVATNLQLQINELKIGKTAQKQYGLTSTYPNDYIEWLGKYNEYWWSLLHGEAYIAYKEKKTNVATTTNGNASTLYFVAGYTKSRAENTIQYSKTVTVDNTSGAVSLNSPASLTLYGSTWDDVDTTYEQLVSISPCYVKGLIDHEDSIYYIPESPTCGGIDGYLDTTLGYYGSNKEDFDFVINTNSIASPFASVVSSEAYAVPAGETTYEHSMDRNTYPDSGTVDGITYTYLGSPFEKIIDGSGVMTGSYVGTGVYGPSNKNSIIFPRKPKIILSMPYDYHALMVIIPHTNAGVILYPLNNCSTVKQIVSYSDGVLSWYCDTSAGWNKAQYQHNYLGTTYYYIAIG